jgi:hypothetical protein
MLLYVGLGPGSDIGTTENHPHISFNKLKEARRKIYVVQWLPESAVDEAFDDGIAGDLAHDLRLRWMPVLEWFSLSERSS